MGEETSSLSALPGNVGSSIFCCDLSYVEGCQASGQTCRFALRLDVNVADYDGRAKTAQDLADAHAEIKTLKDDLAEARRQADDARAMAEE